MPSIKNGLLKGFYRPDYRGGSIVNLLASIIRSRGGRSPHADLSGLPARVLRPYRKIVYLVVDGLGEEQLNAHLEKGLGRRFFAAHPHRVISTVFPATTAAAVTTFATGASPAEHGILGWHLHLRDLGLVSTILPCVTRTGVPMIGKDFDLNAYLNIPSCIDSARGIRELLSYKHIPRSRFSMAGAKWTRRTAFKSLTEMSRAIERFSKRHGRGLAYAYWPEYDTVCHEKGTTHRVVALHFEKIDRMLARLARKLMGRNTLLLVLADHGLMDVSAAGHVDFSNVPGLGDCLSMLPSGDAREVSCFVRPSKVKTFLSIVNKTLSRFCVCIPGETLLALKAFGPGRPHPALAQRLGDYVLLAKDGCAFSSSLPQSRNERLVGNHGGMSAREVRVPLYVIDG